MGHLGLNDLYPELLAFGTLRRKTEAGKRPSLLVREKEQVLQGCQSVCWETGFSKAKVDEGWRKRTQPEFRSVGSQQGKTSEGP